MCKKPDFHKLAPILSLPRVHQLGGAALIPISAEEVPRRTAETKGAEDRSAIELTRDK